MPWLFFFRFFFHSPFFFATAPAVCVEAVLNDRPASVARAVSFSWSLSSS